MSKTDLPGGTENVSLRMKTIARALASPARIVIKVGTSTLTHATGRLNLGRMEILARQISDLANAGHRPILVTSGAVAAGKGRLGMSARPRSLPERQAMAAVGQGQLMQIYEKLFGEYSQVIAQILLTRDDASHRQRYLNVRHTLLTLLEWGVIPIINENDTVATEELQYQFGQNDTLAAMVAALIQADLLIIVSDIDGLYTADPRSHPEAERIPVVEEITAGIASAAGGAGTSLGSGGMRTKIEAAAIATSAGCPMALIGGEPPESFQLLLAGEDVGTLFLPGGRPLLARDRWIAFGRVAAGEIFIDAGAVRALRQGGKSLLPSGIIKVQGEFAPGDLVRVLEPAGGEVARGLVNYNHLEVARLAGHRTAEIESILGYKSYDEIIHRDNLVCL